MMLVRWFRMVNNDGWWWFRNHHHSLIANLWPVNSCIFHYYFFLLYYPIPQQAHEHPYWFLLETYKLIYINECVPRVDNSWQFQHQHREFIIMNHHQPIFSHCPSYDLSSVTWITVLTLTYINNNQNNPLQITLSTLLTNPHLPPADKPPLATDGCYQHLPWTIICGKRTRYPATNLHLSACSTRDIQCRKCCLNWAAPWP